MTTHMWAPNKRFYGGQREAKRRRKKMQAYTHSRISRKHPTHEKKTKHTHTHIPGENAASYGFSCVCPLVTPTGSDERRETILFTLQ